MRMRQHVGSSLLLLPLAAILLLTGCAGSSTSARKTPSLTTATRSSSAAPSPSPSPSSSPFGSIPTDIAQLGWVKLSTLEYPDALAIVPSMPNVLSSCSGAANAGKTNGAITFSASTDGGKSWQTSNTPALAGVCTSLAISPTTVQDVAMYSTTCRGDCGAATQTLYVTTDSGKTWALASSDDSGEAGAVFGWVGKTLFANGAPAATPHAAQQFLAKSTNGGPFSWTTLPAAPGQILTSGTTLYVVTGSQTSCAAPGFCSDLWTSTDLGATWTHLTPTYEGNNLRVEAVASGAGTLFAYDTRAYAGPGSYPLYRSADGGRTWQQLPAIADPSLADTDALAAPDGTLYVTYVSVGSGNSQPAGIYKLAPGASAWHLVSPVVPAQIHVIAIQSDGAGHPAALWGLVFSDRSLGGAWSHPA